MLDKDLETAIIDEYVEKYDMYWECRDKVEALLEDVMEKYEIRAHSITSRTKEKKSLEDKVAKGNGKYKRLEDITDLVGIRIITYFADDVDRVANAIKNEFYIDVENSIDKRELLDPDRFGYLSIHYVVGLNEEKRNDNYYKYIADCKVEIQIRSILQHTWAEIEHDLGYKSKHAVPREIRRSFSRLAGLLEIADDEFIKIRDNLKDYESQIYERILQSPEKVLIDKASLKSFVVNSEIISELNKEIEKISSAIIVEKDKVLDDDFELLKYLKFKTIDELNESLKIYKYDIIEFAKKWLSRKHHNELNSGIAIFYMCFIIKAKSRSPKQICEYLKANGIGSNYERDAYEINAICRQIEENNNSNGKINF